MCGTVHDGLEEGVDKGIKNNRILAREMRETELCRGRGTPKIALWSQYRLL